MNLPHDGVGAALHLEEHLREVDADDSDEEDYPSAEQPDGDDDRRPPTHWLSEDKPLDDHKRSIAPGQQRNGKASIENVHERGIAERGHGVHEERELPAQRVCRFARAQLVHRLRMLLEAGDVPQPPDIELALVVTQERIHVTAGHQPRRDHVLGQIHSGEQPEYAVKPLPGPALEQTALALGLDAEDDVAPFPRDLFHEAGEPFRILLKVAVNQKDMLASCMREARHHRLVVTEIARQVDNRHVRVGSADPDGQFETVVRRAIVDKDDLEIVAHHLPGNRARAPARNSST